MKTSIWWIRRDLRLQDNEALSSAIENSDEILPLFIVDPTLLDNVKSASKRLSFLFRGLIELDEELKKRGSYLTVRSGNPGDVLGTLCNLRNISNIYAEGDNSPYALKRDNSIEENLPLNIIGNTAIIPPGYILKSNKEPYTAFTPFSRTWKNHLLSRKILKAPEHISTPSDIATELISSDLTGNVKISFLPGENEGLIRLRSFVDGTSPKIHNYAELRDNLDLNGTSKLSPYLRFGMLSAHQAGVTAISLIENAPTTNKRKNAETWLNELIWRDYYIHILYHFPKVLKENYRFTNMRWDNNENHFDAWKYGYTGYPVIDAAMRQLLTTGWMHNRARMIVASFLTKDLLIDWRWGEKWFMQHLIDGDPASNNGGWQWTAGTGTDAAPYFRIFNPITQGKKFDPKGIFVRAWLPELERVPDDYIHQPWQMPRKLQNHLGINIGKHFPLPVVDHAWARNRALSVFSIAKGYGDNKKIRPN